MSDANVAENDTLAANDTPDAARNGIIVEPALLHQQSLQVGKITFKTLRLATTMLHTMHVAGGVGLAAIQIGVPARIFVVEVGPVYYTVINPEIVDQDGEQEGFEGCLSIPGFQAPLTRAARVKVIGRNLNGKKIEVVGAHLLARALLHEIDHLNGILFTDRIDEATPPQGQDSQDAPAGASSAA